jgi:hypothetical protein
VADTFCISKGSRVDDSLDSTQSLETFARDHGPGRYDVDERSLESFLSSDHVARDWGHVIRRQEGQIVVDPIPWPASGLVPYSRGLSALVNWLEPGREIRRRMSGRVGSSALMLRNVPRVGGL